MQKKKKRAALRSVVRAGPGLLLGARGSPAPRHPLRGPGTGDQGRRRGRAARRPPWAAPLARAPPLCLRSGAPGRRRRGAPASREHPAPTRPVGTLGTEPVIGGAQEDALVSISSPAQELLMDIWRISLYIYKHEGSLDDLSFCPWKGKRPDFIVFHGGRDPGKHKAQESPGAALRRHGVTRCTGWEVLKYT